MSKVGFNEYEIKEDYIIIYLKNRKGEIFEGLIDIEDLDKLLKLDVRWSLEKSKHGRKNCYITASLYEGIFNNKPKYKTLRLHRFILNIDKRLPVDHINHDTLDNRKKNLRIITDRQNNFNRSQKNSNNSTGYRNVSYDKKTNKYIVQLQIDGKNKALGKFFDVNEAGNFAEKMREKYYGEFKGKS